MKNLFDVTGKVVVMTGACGVLGASIVKYFGAQGAKVVLLDLDRAAELGEKLVEEIKAEGGEACFFPTNVLDKAVLEQNYEQIMAKYGKIDVLLNAAGGNMAAATVPPEKTIFDLDIDAVKKVSELNHTHLFKTRFDIGSWCNGNTLVSKTKDQGPIPWVPAMAE